MRKLIEYLVKSNGYRSLLDCFYILDEIQCHVELSREDKEEIVEYILELARNELELYLDL